jgi:hypothetical protein
MGPRPGQIWSQATVIEQRIGTTTTLIMISRHVWLPCRENAAGRNPFTPSKQRKVAVVLHLRFGHRHHQFRRQYAEVHLRLCAVGGRAAEKQHPQPVQFYTGASPLRRYSGNWHRHFTARPAPSMSALERITDLSQASRHVRLVPEADLVHSNA